MKRGFTLIELMVVIVIIAVLATLGGANYVTSLKRGRNAARLEDLRAIADAQEMYFGEKGVYGDIGNATTCALPGGSDFLSTTNALSSIPTDPSGGAYTCHLAQQTVGANTYNRGFCIIALLEDPLNGANCTACNCTSGTNCTITTATTNTAYCVTNNQ